MSGPRTGQPGTPEPTPHREWSWGPTLYAGSAAFYTPGRVAYPPALAEQLAAELALDGSGRLLDIGCGPGSLTLVLAPLFAEAIGVDADMIAEAAAQAARVDISNLSWRHMRAEELPADLPPPTVITFAQSFHWMDRPRVAATARRMLVAEGALVHVHATTHQGIDTDEQLPHPRPPRAAINTLIQQYLGTARRAGQHVLPQHADQSGIGEREERIYRAAGFCGPQRIELPPRTVQRTPEQVRASVYSLSSSAPHLFGTRLDAFDDQLRSLLDTTAPTGLFSEQLREITIDIWR